MSECDWNKVLENETLSPGFKIFDGDDGADMKYYDGREIREPQRKDFKNPKVSGIPESYQMIVQDEDGYYEAEPLDPDEHENPWAEGMIHNLRYLTEDHFNEFSKHFDRNIVNTVFEEWKKHQLKIQKPARKHSNKKVQSFTGSKSKPKEPQSSSVEVPQRHKDRAKRVRDAIAGTALRNVASKLHKDGRGDENRINIKDFNEQAKQDLPIYDQVARRLLKYKRKGYNSPEAQEKIDELERYLQKRAEAQVFATMDGNDNDKQDLMDHYFVDYPKLEHVSGVPTASDFGRMEPKNRLEYLTSQSANIDAMNILQKGRYKVVFNPNLLNVEGAMKYAKKIGGRLAPVKDYDNDGMMDFLIYDKQGKIAVINGKRLKRDDKQILKRLFYQTFPDPKRRKEIGGYKGWLNTILFQVGPYNWQGLRNVRVSEDTYNLLNFLHEKGYLTKKVESYIPKGSKSISSTIKTHISDAIRAGLEYTFPRHTKASWYLPQNYMRDFIYKLVVGQYMWDYCKNHQILDNLIRTISSYNNRRTSMKHSDPKEPTHNQIFKMLSQYFSKNDAAKQYLRAQLPDILQKYVTHCSTISVGQVIKYTSFVNFIAQTEAKDSVWNGSEPSDVIRIKAFLNELKPQWNAMMRKGCENFLKKRFGQMNEDLYNNLVGHFSEVIEMARFRVPPSFTVNQGKPISYVYDDEKYYKFDNPKYKHYNTTHGERKHQMEELYAQPYYRYEGQKKPINQYLLDANTYADAREQAREQYGLRAHPSRER